MNGSAVFWQSASIVSNVLWATLESLVILSGAVLVAHKWRKGRKAAIVLLEEHNAMLIEESHSRDAREALRTQIEALDNKFDSQHEVMTQVLNRVDYAIFNSGKTGLKNRVDDLWEIVPKIESNIAVILDRTKNL